MQFGSTLALVGVAAALGSYIYLVDMPGEAARVEAESQAKKLVDFPRESVKALEIPLEDGGRARVARTAEGADTWQLEQPLSAPAEEPAVTGILTGLGRLESEFQIEDPPADLSIFGFKDEGRIRVEPKEGEALLVTLGSDTPVAGQRYVRLEGRRSGVFGVRKPLAEGLSTNLYGLRDKRMLQLDPKRVEGVALSVEGKPVMRAERDPVPAAASSGGEAGGDTPPEPAPWTLREPLEERGDTDRITRLVQDLYFARADGFVDTPGKPEEYGLAEPELEIELRAGETTERVKLGRANEKFYLQLGERPPVYEVAERVLTGVGRDLFAYRHKRVFTAPEEGLRRIEFLFPRDGARHALVRGENQDDWTPEGETWQLQRSLAPGDMLFELYQVDATALIESPDRAKLGLEPPQVRVTLSDGQKEIGWLEFGEIDAEQGIAVSSSQSDRVWRVKKELGDVVPLGIEAFRNKWQRAEEPAAQGAGEAPATPPGAPN